MQKNKIVVTDILNVLGLPETYINELLGSYYMMLVAKINEKFPLDKNEVEEAIKNHQDFLEIIAKKYPTFFEDPEIMMSVEEINQKFVLLIDSLANDQQKATIDKMLEEES